MIEAARTAPYWCEDNFDYCYDNPKDWEIPVPEPI